MSGAASATQAGLDPTTLMTLLGALNRQGVEGKTSIRGRLEVRTGIEDHELTFASQCDRHVRHLPSAGRGSVPECRGFRCRPGWYADPL